MDEYIIELKFYYVNGIMASFLQNQIEKKLTTKDTKITKYGKFNIFVIQLNVLFFV